MPLADPPREAGSLADMPATALPEHLHRVSRRDHGADPWYSASVPDDPDEGGRFDLPAPMGTMHTATTPIAAVLEAFQGHLDPLEVLDVAELRTRSMAVIDVPPSAPEAADLTDPSVLGAHGITAALWAGTSRQVSQAWAFSLRRDGWWSLHTGVQHDPTGSMRGVAVLDHEGDHAPTVGGEWSHSSRDLHDDAHLLAQLAEHGVHVRRPGNLDIATAENER